MATKPNNYDNSDRVTENKQRKWQQIPTIMTIQVNENHETTTNPNNISLPFRGIGGKPQQFPTIQTSHRKQTTQIATNPNKLKESQNENTINWKQCPTILPPNIQHISQSVAQYIKGIYQHHNSHARYNSQ